MSEDIPRRNVPTGERIEATSGLTAEYAFIARVNRLEEEINKLKLYTAQLQEILIKHNLT